MRELRLLFCLLLVAFVRAELDTNLIGSDDGWAFSSKFCFDYNPPDSVDAAGLIAAQVFTLDAGPPSGNLTLLVYDDEADSWPRIYGRNGLTCAQKSAAARVSYPIAFDANGQWSLPSQFQSVFEHRRPRFWYVVVAHAACLPTGTLSTSIRFVNVGSSPWNQEFGVNERGLNTLYLVYFFVYAALCAYHFYGVRSLVQTNSYHPVVRAFTSALILTATSVFLYMIHYAAFASNGVGVLPLSGFAAVLEGIGRICFTLLLMLVAKGHAVTNDQIDNRNALFLVLGGLLLLHFVMLVYDIAARDEASTLYLYETSPGIILVAATALTGAWFSNAIFQTWRAVDDPDKKAFFRNFGLIFSPWHFLLLVLVLIAKALDPWVRDAMFIRPFPLQVREIVVTSVSMFVFSLYMIACAHFMSPHQASLFFKVSTPDVGGLAASSGPSQMGSLPYESL